MRKILPWLLSILLIVVVLCLLGGALLNHWIAGDGFHAMLENKSSRALGAKTSFGPLHWGWFELSSPRFHAEGQGATALRNLEVGSVHGRLHPSALLQGLLRIEEITLDHAKLHIDTARHPKDASLSVHQKLEPKATPSLPSWVPSLFVVDLICANKIDILIDLPASTPSAQRSSLELLGTSLQAHPEGKETRIEAQGGILKNSYLPEMEIKTIHCRIKPDLVDLTGADLAFPGGGALQLEGVFPDTKRSSLTGLWQNVPITTLLPSLKPQVSGTLDGNATVSWDLVGSHVIEGKVKADKIILLGIPMLNEVSRLTRMEAFQHLFLQRAQATFSIREDSSSWHDVVLESEQLIKLLGDAEIQKGGAISGSFQLGLSSPIVKAIPGASQVFSKDQHDGYYWTSLQVGGTLAHLTEDLTPRIIAAVLSNAGLLLQQGVKQGLQILGLSDNSLPSTNQPTKLGTNAPATPPPSTPVETIKQGAGAALDVLGGFLK